MSLQNNIFDINKLLNSGIKYCKTLCKAIKNDFWRDVLGSFKIYVSKCNFTTWSEVINMPLLYNENLRIGSKHFLNSTLYNHGIRYIRDVLNEDGSIKNWNDIKNATSNGINFLEFYGIISSVKSFFSKQDIASESNPLQGLEGPNINCYFFNIISRLNSNKFIYNILIKNKKGLCVTSSGMPYSQIQILTGKPFISMFLNAQVTDILNGFKQDSSTEFSQQIRFYSK